MVEFYDHPITGRLMMRGPAGGHGRGVTSTFDGAAGDAAIEAYPHEYEYYELVKKRRAAQWVADREAEQERALALIPIKNEAVLEDEAVDPPPPEPALEPETPALTEEPQPE